MNMALAVLKPPARKGLNPSGVRQYQPLPWQRQLMSAMVAPGRSEGGSGHANRFVVEDDALATLLKHHREIANVDRVALEAMLDE